MSQPALLTSEETCQALGIPRSTLLRWVESERIAYALKAPGLRGAYFFDPAEVERLKAEVAA